MSRKLDEFHGINTLTINTQNKFLPKSLNVEKQMRRMKLLFSSLLLSLFSLAAFAQVTIKGTIVDSSNNEPLIGAAVVVDGTTNGTSTNFDGSFTLNSSDNVSAITVTFIGYNPMKKEVNATSGTVNLGTIKLKSAEVGLEEVSVMASVAVQRKTPVAVSTISAEKIATQLGSQEFPEIMKMTPGVYATKQGGGIGDSRINVRGFSQENIAVMINGIPVNDMENGKVYWSNWAGLSDATRSMQVQRGLGASKLAINSVGGTLNILTKASEAKRGGFVEASTTDFGIRKYKVGLNTGLMDNGLAVTFIGSHTEGTGYIDETWAKAWSYFLTINKNINDSHRLVFTLSGAPQEHGQRPGSKYDMLSYEQFETHGTTYNKNWGYLNGERLNEKENFYHKPQAGLTWYWTIDEGTSLSTAAYGSYGTGGGSGYLGKYKGKWQYGPKLDKVTGQQNYDEIYAANQANAVAGDGAEMILRESRNNHKWIGLLSTLNHDLNENLKLIAGVDARYYKGEHYREVRDLLGASHWDDTFRSGNSNAQVGDKVDYYNDAVVVYDGTFGQLEYSNDGLSTFIAATISNTGYIRTDYFNYKDADGKRYAAESDAEMIIGYNAKTGLNYNFDSKHNAYFNAGYYSKAPNIRAVFLNYKNDLNPNLTNEKVYAAEIGYGFKSKNFILNANAYITKWDDRFLKADYKKLTGEMDDKGRPETKEYTANFNNLSEIHQGIELEAKLQLAKNLELQSQVSIGDWFYDKDVVTDLYDTRQTLVEEDVTVATKDLKVANAPQTQVGFALNYKFLDGFRLNANWVYYDQLYADFDIDDRIINEGKDADRVQSWKLPAYDVLDLTLSYDFKIAGLNSKVIANVYNVFDKDYMAEGFDGRNHDKDSFKGFKGWGRNFNFSLKVNF